VKFVLIYSLSNNYVIDYGVVQMLLTWTLWIKVFNIFCRLSTTTVHTSSKKCRSHPRFEGARKLTRIQVHSEGLQMLGATLQNLIVKATWAPNLCTPVLYLFRSYYKLNSRKIFLTLWRRNF